MSSTKTHQKQPHMGFQTNNNNTYRNTAAAAAVVPGGASGQNDDQQQQQQQQQNDVNYQQYMHQQQSKWNNTNGGDLSSPNSNDLNDMNNPWNPFQSQSPFLTSASDNHQAILYQKQQWLLQQQQQQHQQQQQQIQNTTISSTTTSSQQSISNGWDNSNDTLNNVTEWNSNSTANSNSNNNNTNNENKWNRSTSINNNTTTNNNSTNNSNTTTVVPLQNGSNNNNNNSNNSSSSISWAKIVSSTNNNNPTNSSNTNTTTNSNITNTTNAQTTTTTASSSSPLLSSTSSSSHNAGVTTITTSATTTTSKSVSSTSSTSSIDSTNNRQQPGKDQMNIGTNKSNNNNNNNNKQVDTGTEIWSSSGQSQSSLNNSNNNNNGNMWLGGENSSNNGNSEQMNDNDLDNNNKNWSNQQQQQKWQNDQYNNGNKNKQSNNNNWLQSESPTKQIVQSQWYDPQQQAASSSSSNNNQWPNANSSSSPQPWLDNNNDKISSSTSSINNNSSGLQAAGGAPPANPAGWSINKGPIEPCGWDEPEFKVAKKSDDGTSIWGDPESHKQSKVQKWQNVTRHVPNPQTIRPPLGNEQDVQNSQQQQQQNVGQYQQQQLQAAAAAAVSNNQMTNIQSNTVTSTTSTILSQNDQWSKPSQWKNTPAAPPSLMNEHSNDNEWTHGLVDTTTWLVDSNNKNDPKNNFDPSVGVIDTSKWSSSNGPPAHLNAKMQQIAAAQSAQQQQPSSSASASQVQSSQQATTPNSLNNIDWNSANQIYNRNDDLLDSRMTKNQTSSRIITSQNSNNPQSAGNVNPLQTRPTLQTQQSQQQNKVLPNVSSQNNFLPQQQQQQQQQQQSNTSQLMNQMVSGNGNQLNSGQQNAPAPQIQHQLIESFRLAVTSGLLSPDLLNTKLPSDVLTMLYQLFQVQGQFMNVQTKLDNLPRRRAQLTPQQYKSEYDSLSQESQLCREHLILLKSKINNAHMLLKSKTQPSFGNEHGSDPLMQPLNQLNLKDSQLANSPLSQTPLGGVLNQPQQQQRSISKLMDNKSMNNPANRQQSQIGGGGKNQQQLYQQFNNNNMGGQNNWGNFNPSPGNGGNFGGDLPQLPFDDRITPFIPGQPWAGHGQTSIEDDPSCTPGSVSKSLLHDIDAESILSNLQHKSTWSETLTTTTNAINANSRQNRGSWSSSVGYTTPTLTNTQSSIGEQLWGVPRNPNNQAPGSRGGNNSYTGGNNPAGAPGTIQNRNNNNNNNNFNTNMNNQQFSRSNSWNVSPQSNGKQNGQSLLLTNIPPYMDQNFIRMLCSQHAVVGSPYFKFFNNNNVIVRYSSKEEAQNAQNKLNGSAGTLTTQILTDSEVKECETHWQMNAPQSAPINPAASHNGNFFWQ